MIQMYYPCLKNTLFIYVLYVFRKLGNPDFELSSGLLAMRLVK